MVIVASGMARGRVRLATTTTTLPQHGGHSHPGYLEGLKPKRGFVFRAMALPLSRELYVFFFDDLFQLSNLL